MSERRALCPAERMVDVFDRAHTLTFTVVAKLRGAPSQGALEAALRAIEQRHPLLRARIVRSKGQIELVPGEAGPIPLLVQEAAEARWQTVAEQSLDHRVWDDHGPRAALHVLRHPGERTTLLLCFHHLTSDGSSGIIAMRDLVQHLNQQPFATARVPSPGQPLLYPQGHGSLRWQLRAVRQAVASMLGEKPFRFRPDPSAARSTGLSRITFERAETEKLALRAKRAGATVHGVLCAALARAVAARAGQSVVKQRLLHPVDLRRGASTQRQLGDAVGYYVSSLTTDHLVDPHADLSVLARDITMAVRNAKAEQHQLMSAPIQGPWVARSAQGNGELRGFRDYAERRLMANTSSLTNLGPLEPLGVQAHTGAFAIEDLFYVAAGSVLSALGASASSFDGRLSFTLCWVEPAVSRAAAEALTAHVRDELARYVGAAELTQVAQ